MSTPYPELQLLNKYTQSRAIRSVTLWSAVNGSTEKLAKSSNNYAVELELTGESPAKFANTQNSIDETPITRETTFKQLPTRRTTTVKSTVSQARVSQANTAKPQQTSEPNSFLKKSFNTRIQQGKGMTQEEPARKGKLLLIQGVGIRISSLNDSTIDDDVNSFSPYKNSKSGSAMKSTVRGSTAKGSTRGTTSVIRSEDQIGLAALYARTKWSTFDEQMASFIALKTYGYVSERENTSHMFVQNEEGHTTEQTNNYLQNVQARIMAKAEVYSKTREEFEEESQTKLNEYVNSVKTKIQKENLDRTVKASCIIANIAKRLLKIARSERTDKLAEILDRVMKLKEKREEEAKFEQSVIVLQTYFRAKLLRKRNNAENVVVPKMKKGKKDKNDPRISILWAPPSPLKKRPVGGKRVVRAKGKAGRRGRKGPVTFEQLLKVGKVAKPPRRKGLKKRTRKTA